MRKAYGKGCALMMAALILMTGCGSEQVNLTPEQESQVGEYAAMALLRHDANNRSRLVSMEKIEQRDQELLEKKQEEKKEQEEQSKQEGMDPVEDTPVIGEEQETSEEPAVTLEDFFALPEGMSIDYLGFGICDSFPQDGGQTEYFALDAADGKLLLVLHFNLVNESQSNQSIDILSQNAVIRINVNGAETSFALTTMLEDDMLTYAGEVPVGGTVPLVLLAEIESATANTVSTVSLDFKMNDTNHKIQLQ